MVLPFSMILLPKIVMEYGMNTKVVKLTVSIPGELVQLADKVAKEKNISRSKIVSSCLRELAKQILQQELEEGYRVMTKTSKQLARQTVEVQREVMPEW
jgi:metal-responsive CopG/Arc/MetJ family transcriptional regulator